jgi:beta-lactam-binding protein with PASTA domain/predicted Ser/Thr protein kinase
VSTPRLLGGRYEVGDLLGRGGMAEVHHGYDTRLSRPVAIKMLRSDLARDSSLLNRFRREAQSAAGLNHASIVAVYDSGEDHVTDIGETPRTIPYIVMEYVEGQTLRQLLGEHSPLDPAHAARITEGILDALAYSHRMGIVHRDIKPANVMIGKHGEIKVMDFGIARAVADANATMTQTQAVMGTAQYLSPEQAQGQHVDARSDLYSTGCLLFELLTGRPPFQGDSPVAIAYQHVGEPPPHPSSFNPDVDPALDAVVLHALEKDREARYQDATAFRADLQAARLGRPISDAARGTALASGAATLARGAGAAGAATTVIPEAQAGESDEYVPPDGNGNTATLPAVGHDPDDEPRKRRGLAYVLLVLAVLGALALIVLFGKGLLDRPPATTAKVTVPTVVGQPRATAEAAVRAAGLVPEVNEVASPKEVDTVVDQNPEGGGSAPRGSTVELSVSSGPDTVAVPDLSGYSAAEAKVALENLGLKVGKTDQVDDTEVDKGKIVSTDPAAGQTVPVDTAVTLKVSSGLATVPDLTQKQLSDAVSELSDKGFHYKTKLVPSKEAEGTVLKQSVKAGTKVDYGTTVTLTVAQAPAPTPTTTTSTTTTPPPTTTTTPPPTTTTTAPPVTSPTK